MAERLDLAPGDSLLSSPETLFDLADVYPLKMRVVGVLAPTHSPDDRAVLVDVKTAWVVQGLVHGHADLTRSRDRSRCRPASSTACWPTSSASSACSMR